MNSDERALLEVASNVQKAEKQKEFDAQNIIKQLTHPSRIQATRAKLLSSLEYFIVVMNKARGEPPFVVKPFHKEIMQSLTDIVTGKADKSRLMINMLPRLGKSTIVQYFIAWTYAINPHCEYIYAAASKKLILSFSRIIKDEIIGNKLYATLFGITLSDRADGQEYWQVKKNNQVCGTLATYTILSNPTGRGAGKNDPSVYGGALILDDIMAAKDDDSEIMTEKIYDQYVKSFKTRLNNTSSPIVCIGQRLSINDVYGQILEAESIMWKVLRVQAFPDGKEESLWAAKYSTLDLKFLKRNSPAVFAAQYQQMPLTTLGEVFDISYLKYYANIPDNFRYVYATVDVAMTKNTHSDYTVISVWGTTAQSLYWLDMVRGKFDTLEIIAVIKEINKKWAHYCRMLTFHVEKKVSGHAVLDVLYTQQDVHALPIERDASSKLARASMTTHFIASGRLLLPNDNDSMVSQICDELSKFTRNDSHKHDDIVDTMVDAIEIANSHVKDIHICSLLV